MALELTFDKFGFTAAKAYHVINQLGFGKNLNEPAVPGGNGDTHIQVLTYMDKATREADGEPMISRSFKSISLPPSLLIPSEAKILTSSPLVSTIEQSKVPPPKS